MFLLVLSPAAFAQRYDVTLPIVRPAPVYVEGRDSHLAVFSYDVASGHPDQTIASSWSYVRCTIEAGVVNVIFEAPVDAWPTTFPASATCASGGYTLVAHLAPVPMSNDYDPSFSPAAGVTVASAVGVGFGRTYHLPIGPVGPVGPSYVEGTWPAKLTPTTSWTGVGCTMHVGDDGQPYFQLSATPTAPAGSGYCELQSASGVPQAIAVTVTR